MASLNESSVLDRVQRQLYVNGEWRESRSEATLDVVDPSTGEVLTDVADASSRDALDALEAAARVQESWAAQPPRERSEILRRAFDLVNERADDFATLITLEMGKPLAEARAEVAYGADFLRWFSEEAPRIDGQYVRAPNGHGHILTMKQPVGPCLLITPWNFPLAMGTRKIAPAIAAGCSMVVKPAQQTPLTTLALAQVLEECGLPAGVLNVVTTSQASEVASPLIADRRLRKLSFTGSTAVGRELLAQASKQVLRVSMELGGNAPLIVFDDADMDLAVEGALVAKMRNMGQSCIAANRILVSETVADSFSNRLAERMSQLQLGRGTESGVDVGPLIDSKARDGVDFLVQDAIGRGAEALVGGGPMGGEGFFYAPTVLARVPHGAPITRREIFGPVAPVSSFSSEDEAIRAANDTEYGLAAYVFTDQMARALRVSERLDVGMVGLNRGVISDSAAPFGGVGASGIGREGGREGIGEYLSTKYVSIPA